MGNQFDDLADDIQRGATEHVVESVAQEFATAIREAGATLDEAELDLDVDDPALEARIRARTAEILASR